MDSLWAIIFVALAVAMAVGPVLIIKPNKRQQQQQKLRERALSLGLKVQMLPIYDNESPMPCYLKSWPGNGRQPKDLPEGQLLHKNYEHELHLANHWQSSVTREAYESLETLLYELPESVKAVFILPHGIALAWSERGGQTCLESLASWLTKAEGVLVRG